MPNKNSSAVGVFSNHQDAESAVKELQKSGYDMKKLSVVGKDYHSEENVIGYYNTGDRMARRSLNLLMKLPKPLCAKALRVFLHQQIFLCEKNP